MTVSGTLLLVMFIALLAGLIIGTPLAYVLGGVAVIIGYIGWGTSTFSIVMSQTFGVMSNYTLIAIPMFVLMANFLTYSGVADGLFEAVRKLFGPVKGGLAVAVMIVSTVFAATTGVVGASVLTMGLLALPILDRYNYSHSLAAGTICAGGSLGILIPPSIMLVTMASLAQVSVSKLLLSAFTPGLILAAVYIVYILITCKIHPEKGPAMSEEELKTLNKGKLVRDVLINLIPPLLLIIGVLGTIFLGVATPTEASACGALMALILTICYGNFSWKMIHDSVIGCLKTSAMCFLIMIAANSFCAIFFALGGDTAIENFVASVGIGKWGCYILMMAIIFFLGCFIDWIGIVAIVVPIFLPILTNLGFDNTIWLCTCMAVIMQTCFMTPPFGFALFYVKALLPEGYTMMEVYKGVIPFIISVLLVTVLVTLFPDIVMWLPNVSYGS
jgi:tripartite ATP-independent transporter DctM subunit